MTIQDILQYLTKLDYDTLIDWLDYVEYREAVDTGNKTAIKAVLSRRRGKTAMNELDLRGDAQKAYDVYRQLSKADKINSKLTAKALRDALKPQLRQRDAQGKIQLKYKTNWLFYMNGQPALDDNGHHKRKVFGPYLYLRLWATGERS